MKDLFIQSHRGAGNLAPENTLESFELAWRIGTVPEADVRTTKDGVVAAFHDNDFTRLAPDTPAEIRNLSVSELNWDDIRNLDVGSYKGEQFRGQRIPRLSDVFAAMSGHPDRMLYVDFKYITLPDLAELARQYGVTRQIILASTVYQHILDWMELVPESMTLLWMGGAEECLRERMEELRRADLKAITILQIHVRLTDPSAPDPFDPSSEFLREVGEEIKPRGIIFQTLPWGVSEVWVYHRLMDLGVQSFATDEPEATLKAIETYKGRSCE